MCVHILSGQAQLSDKDLLQEFIDMLNTITDCREGKSYSRRLYQLSVVVMDLAIAAESHHKRRRIASDLERPTASPLSGSSHTILHRARSHTIPPLNSNNSHTTSEMADIEDRSFDGAGFPEPDDLFALVDTTTHMDAWGQDSDNELVSNTGSCSKGLFENFDPLAFGLESLGDVSGVLRV